MSLVQMFLDTNKWGDPRVSKYFLMDSPAYLVAILVSYLAFSIKFGPQLMKKKKPFDLTKTMVVYNASQILINGFLFLYGCYLLKSVCMFCLLKDFEEDMSPLLFRLYHTYFLVKLYDLADTIFIVLRKKSEQISGLHIYHHSIMVFGSWMVFKFFPEGYGSFLGFINVFVHTVMYSYYLMTSINPEFKRKTWIKRTITQIQILQHISAFIVYTRMLLIGHSPAPKLHVFCLMNFLLMIYLFVDFYVKTYVKKKKIA